MDTRSSARSPRGMDVVDAIAGVPTGPQGPFASDVPRDRGDHRVDPGEAGQLTSYNPSPQLIVFHIEGGRDGHHYEQICETAGRDRFAAGRSSQVPGGVSYRPVEVRLAAGPRTRGSAGSILANVGMDERAGDHEQGPLHDPRGRQCVRFVEFTPGSSTTSVSRAS